MENHIYAIAGLVLGMAGVSLIFFWGRPQPDFQEYIGIAFSGPEQDELKKDVAKKKRRYRIISGIGLALIFFGFVFQLIDILML